MAKTILVTGAAGFIGSHTVERLLRRGDRVIGLDNLNDYYDPSRKEANLREVSEQARAKQLPGTFEFLKGDIRDRQLVGDLFSDHQIDTIIHLAAMAGVRVPIDDPGLYYDVNVLGTLALLDAAVGRIGAGIGMVGPDRGPGDPWVVPQWKMGQGPGGLRIGHRPGAPGAARGRSGRDPGLL